MTIYQVMCSVSGGVTGTRTSLLKNNGVVQVYDSKAMAQAAVDACYRAVRDCNTGAQFTYWIVTKVIDD